MNTMPAVRCTGLSKHYYRQRALNDINLHIPEGCFFGLVGPNGAGKTTLLKTLLGLIRPSSGSSELMGIRSRSLGSLHFQDIAFVAESQALPNRLTVSQLLRYCERIQPRYNRALTTRLQRLLEVPNQQRIATLSRGMRMKLCLLTALSKQPRMLIMDEPFSGMDVAVREDIITGLLELADDRPKTVLFASHALYEVERLADHVGYLSDGQLHFTESMDSLLNRFRQINLTLDNASQLPEAFPAAWLGGSGQDKSARNGLRHQLQFVHSAFSDEQFQSELSQVLPAATDIRVNHMDLQQIFIANRKLVHNESREASQSA